MLKSKHFPYEHELLNWVNENIASEGLASFNIKSIFRDVTNGEWLIFYID